MAGQTTNDHGIAAFKSETSYGVDAFGGGAPADEDVLAVIELTITPQLTMIEGDRLTATIAGECHSMVKLQNDVSVTVPLIGSSAAGEAPPVAVILKAGNMAETIDTGVSVTYTTELVNSAALTPSMTALHYQRSVEDNTARRIMARGVKGSPTFNLTLGEEATLSLTGVAPYDEWPTDPAALPTLPEEYNGDQCAWPVSTLVVTAGGINYPVESMEIALNFTQELARTGDAAGGGVVGKVTNVKPKSGARTGGSFELNDGGAALADVIAKSKSGAKMTITAVLTKGARAITFSGTIQLGMITNAAPRYTVPFYFVRPDGESGQGGDLTVTFT